MVDRERGAGCGQPGPVWPVRASPLPL